MSIEEEARFVARNAKHNLKLVKKQAELIDPVKLDGIINWLEMMDKLHKHDLEAVRAQKKKARLAGRTPLSHRLRYLIASILPFERQKRKEGTA